jgi:integrase
MTSPHPIADQVGDLPVTQASLVLQSRELHPDTDRSRLSRFGDPSWDLFPALPDRHSANQAIHWDTYPAAFRHVSKLYLFALLNIVEHAPRLAYARTTFPSVKTIWAELGYLRLLLAWLADRGITRFADVTTGDLDHYLRHVTDDTSSSTARKRKALLAVQRLHAYRQFLPPPDRLPTPTLWGGASAAELADHPDPRLAENRTPRIHPDVMHPLLSAALLVVDTIATDLLPAARRLINQRARALQLDPDNIARQRHKTGSRWYDTRDQLALFLQALADTGYPLPGLRHGRGVEIDLTGLAVAGHIDGELLRKGHFQQLLDDSGLRVELNMLRVNRFTTISSRSWRQQPVDATGITSLIRHITTACFLVIAYLSGVRTGEALNLLRGCVTRDPKLGLIFMSGQQLKASPDRRDRSPNTIPWVINEHSAKAIAVLEDLSVSTRLFPPGKWGSPEWLGSSRCRTTGSINDDIPAFIAWFNTEIATTIGHAAIGADEHGNITGSRLRRTLAWHIVRRPGGTVAGATQYGHLHTQLVTGYAGNAASGFLDEISFEEFLLRAEQIHNDHQQLQRGEHVSGPAADAYRQRLTAGSQFAGLTVTTPAQVNNALANPNLQIHHGALLTCVWRPETAACQDTSNADNTGPAWPRCRLTCTNIAYTDRDIAEVRRHVAGLRVDVTDQAIPHPLRQRIQQRLHEHERVLAAHGATRPHADTDPTPRSCT